MRTYIQVWVEHNLSTLDSLTYWSDQPLQVGVRVLVPLRSKQIVGLVCAVFDHLPEVDQDKIKSITNVLDERPIFDADQFALCEHMKDITMASSISVVKAMLPSLLKPSSTKLTITKEKWVKVNRLSTSLTHRQQEIVDWVRKRQPVLYAEYRKYAKSLSKKLIDDQVLCVEVKDKQYTLLPNHKQEAFSTLTSDQQNAKDAITLNKAHTYLLFGITGSGKTEVFMHVVSDVLAMGKHAMILVPEVALTPQMIDRFTRRFDVPIIVYHSHLSDNERYHQYQQVKNSEATIIIGTRSAVFLPMKNMGIIIMDEEHDLSFKQDVSPFYHARDVALYLSKQHQCPLLLASATPSLESYARALKGVYTLLSMPKRINNTLANIRLINMKQAIAQEGSIFLSNALKQAIALRLQRKEQVILLLNRRGYLPSVQCASCFELAKCHFCDVTLTYHVEDKKLHCHHCNHIYDRYECTHCHNTRFMGSGLATQRIEDMVTQMFPQAKVARLDYDATRKKNSHQAILDDFTNHQQDILIGTQMVAKGLDIPNVTLVGILQADAALSFNDYHINESTYAMISQAAGRSGRHNQAGEVIVQAFDPTHYVIEAVAKQDYDLFFKTEMHYRKLAQLPPYFYLISMVIHDKKEDMGHELAINLRAKSQSMGLMVLGPMHLGRKKDRYGFRLVYKTKDLKSTTQQLKRVMHDFISQAYKISINVNPYHLE